MGGEGGRKWVDLHPFDSVSPSSRGRGREAAREHQNILQRKRSGLPIGAAERERERKRRKNPSVLLAAEFNRI